MFHSEKQESNPYYLKTRVSESDSSNSGKYQSKTEGHRSELDQKRANLEPSFVDLLFSISDSDTGKGSKSRGDKQYGGWFWDWGRWGNIGQL